MPQAVIFDMDGVLLDSEPMHMQVQDNMAAELGFKMTRAEHLAFVGISPLATWEQLCARHGLPQNPQELAEEQGRRYLAQALEKAVPRSGLLPLLDYLQARDKPLAVASSNQRETVDAVLGKLGVRDFFRAVVTGSDAERSKPWPDIFLKAARLLRALPADCLVIEDAATGVAAARSAGMRCIGLCVPDAPFQDLSSADITVSSLDEIIPLLKNKSCRCG
jgi:HAD superfamily hydrolase (TIGR01509 family)